MISLEKYEGKSGKSKYSDYFEIDHNISRAICKICGIEIKCPNRATTGMKNHLRGIHNIVLTTTTINYKNCKN